MQLRNISNEHQRFVMSLAKDGDEIISTLSSKRAHLLHMVLGVVGEANEVDEVLTDYTLTPEQQYDKLADELGDVVFYLIGAAHEVEEPESSEWVVSHIEPMGTPRMLFKRSAELAEYSKKLVMYNREWDNAILRQLIANVYDEVVAIANSYGMSINFVTVVNKQKLSKRYAGGYSDERANNKADKR